jgi:hypothetical protein
MLEMVKPGPVRPPFGPKAVTTEGTLAATGQAHITPAMGGITAAPVRAGSARTEAPNTARAYSRQRHPAKKALPTNASSAAFGIAKEIATRAAQEIRSQYGSGLTRDEGQKLVSTFRAGVVPRRRAGRRPLPHVTAAYENWKAGMRGVALYRSHIAGWDRHGEWRRKAEARALMDAIRSRRRREHKSAKEVVV